MQTNNSSSTNLQRATLAGGCFWCLDAGYRRLKGVTSVVSGYAGGHVPGPSYEAVCTGTTGHAEVVQVEFDPSVITYRELLEVFYGIHDPTTLNRQGNDVGTQYRSAIFPQTDEQRAAAIAAIDRAQADLVQPVVTTIEPAAAWYPAEDYHKEYFAREGASNPYCQAVIAPKLAKFRKSYQSRIRNTVPG